MEPDEKGRSGKSGPSKVVVGETRNHITALADTRRRRCRGCRRPDARPIAPAGSSLWWDLCLRCTRRVMTDGAAR